ncbi:MAG: peptidyl-prolyl cis-trans isomerase, partial [Phycisphaerae bacterium]|nr:peptidyl-prolyl cis-trans isomerase [Phycisphaerae bacterium]
MVVSDAEVEAEAESILKVMVPQATTAAERKQVLGRLLAQKQVSIEQWTSSIRMAAELRKLAEPKVKITDELLREEFRRIYGHLVVVRQIEVRSLDKAQEVLEKLQEGEKFADMAWKYSINKNA